MLASLNSRAVLRDNLESCEVTRPVPFAQDKLGHVVPPVSEELFHSKAQLIICAAAACQKEGVEQHSIGDAR
jgi:hypothetical protein